MKIISAPLCQLLLTALMLIGVFVPDADASRIIQYNVDNGLFNNQARLVVSMPDHRILSYVDGTICLFDGYNFRNIGIDRNKAVSVESFVNTDYYFDKNNYLWLRTFHELYALDCRTYDHVSIPELLKASGVREKLKNFFIDTDGNAWLLTATDKLYCYDFKHAAHLVYSIKSTQAKAYRPTVSDVVEAGGLHYIFVTDGNMLCWDQKRNRVMHKIRLEDEKHGYRLKAWVVDQNHLLIRTSKQIIAYNLLSGQCSKILDDSNIMGFAHDGKDGFSLCGFAGVYHFDAHLRLVSHEGKVVDSQTGEEDRGTWQGITYDWQGGLWIASSNKGVLYNDNYDRPQLMNLLPVQASSLPGNEVVTILPYDNHTLYVLTHQGLYTYSLKTKTYTLATAQLAKVEGKTFIKDSKGLLWISTLRDGLISYDPKTQQVTQRSAKPLGYNFCEEMKPGVFLVCYHNNIFGLYDVSTPAFIDRDISKLHPELLDMRNIVCICPAEGGYMLGSQNGYVFFDPKTLRIDMKKYQILGDNQYSNQCTALLRGMGGNIWIGTANGLLVYNEKSGEVRRFAERQGLINSNIRGLARDRQGYLWITTANGIAYMKETDNYANFISRADNGIDNSNFLERAICMGPDGHVYMGTSAGMIDLDPRLLLSTRAELQPQVMGFRIFESLDEGSNVASYVEAYNRIEDNSIHLRYNENYFRIDVSSLNYRYHNMTVYRYRLNGLENGWRTIDGSNGEMAIEYSGLPAGSYTLIVEASMMGTRWSAPMKLHITIAPPLWATWWAWLLYVLLIAALGWYVIRMYLRHKRDMMNREREEFFHRDQERLNEMKFRFFTNISHEFRTFLTLILTPLQTLLERDDIPENGEKLLDVIKRSAQSLNTLVNQLLDFRSLEQDGEQLNPSIIYLRTLFEPIEPTFGHLARERNITFEVDDEAVGNTTFYLDVPKVQKIINNLLSNAFKFTLDGGSVTLSAHINDSNGQLVLAVADTGVGMTQTDMDHIFDRFYQGRTEYQGTQHSTGSGIGLNLVKGYVELHQGTISVSSKVGRGSTFTVSLPNHTPASLTETIPQPLPAFTGDLEENEEKQEKDEKVKLLVVEDNLDFRAFMIDQLKPTYTVYAAADGEEALSTARVVVPDIIVSDVMMPKMDGYQLCRSVKEDIRLSHIPVVLLTAKNTDQGRTEGYQAGADSYITKPFNMSMLQACIQMLLDQRRERQKTFEKEAEVNPKKLTITPIDEQLLKKAMACMERNMGNSDYDVVAFSSDMAMERTTLYRKMVAIVGKTPLQFIHSVRMKHAAQLLRNGNYSVSDVSVMVGYNSTKYFSQHFKKEFGVYPSKFS